MKIQYCSDLHLEFEKNNSFILKNPLKIKGEILILAGDIVPILDEFLILNFFDYISANFEIVYWIPGNHEFYHNDLQNFKSNSKIKIRKNVFIVNNCAIQYKDINFLFSTLWTHISSEKEKIIEERVSDFNLILNGNKKIKASSVNLIHKESFSFLKNELALNKPKTIVVTHHLPSKQCNLETHNNSEINEAFCVELTEFISKSNANFWIYGHSHFNQKPLFIGNTVLLTNQLGYIHLNENVNFKSDAFFSI